MNPKEINIVKRKEYSGKHSIEIYLDILSNISEELRETEKSVDDLRDRKWELVRLLKDMGHDFTATTEGMDVVLSSSPSFNWS